MKTALIVWNNRIAPVFDAARKAIAFTTSNFTECEVIELPDKNALEKIAALAEAGISDILCGAISNHCIHMAAAYGISVHPFLAGDVEDVATAWTKCSSDLSAFTMAGCKRRQVKNLHTGRNISCNCDNNANKERKCNMPNRDGTGPMNLGFGYGNGGQNAESNGGRRGFGNGCGRGERARLRICRRTPAINSPEYSSDDQNFLKAQAEALKAQLDTVQKRLNELENSK